MTGDPLGKTHSGHTYIVHSTTRDGALVMVYHITLSKFVLLGGGVILHYEGGGFSIFIINDEFNLLLIITWLYVVFNDISNGLLVSLIIAVVLVFVEEADILKIVVLAVVVVASVPIVHYLTCLSLYLFV